MKRIPFAAFPLLGAFPTSDAVWVSANQPGGDSRVIQDPSDGRRVMELGIAGANGVPVGSRVFHNRRNGQWLTWEEYLGKTIQVSWPVWISPLDLVDGADNWLTCGFEAKDETSKNALIQTNITEIDGQFYYVLNNGGIGSTPIPMEKWHTVTMTILLAVKGSYALTFGDDYLYAEGPTTDKNKPGLLGTAWCFYGNNLKTEYRSFARFRMPTAYVLD